jgi:hypothetical protein
MSPFQGLSCLRRVTQGVALGWIISAPLGLRMAARGRRGTEASHEAPGLPAHQTQRRRMARRRAGALGGEAFITDRQVLDRQLQDAIYQIEHAQGVVKAIDHLLVHEPDHPLRRPRLGDALQLRAIPAAAPSARPRHRASSSFCHPSPLPHPADSRPKSEARYQRSQWFRADGRLPPSSVLCFRVFPVSWLLACCIRIPARI